MARTRQEPIGYTQADVLFAISELKDNAHGSAVHAELERLSAADDASQVFAAIRKLLKRGLITQSKQRKSPSGGPPFKIYSVTPEGRAVMVAVFEHYVVRVERWRRSI